MDISNYHGVLVFAEQRRGQIQKVAFELLGIGRQIADTLEEPLMAVLIGSELTQAHSADLIALGADRVILVDRSGNSGWVANQYSGFRFGFLS